MNRTTERKRVYALPGTMCDRRLWQRLKLDFTLVHTHIPKQGTIDAIVSAIADALPEEPIDLLGFSLGGYLVSAFCARFPERINRLCVIANSPSALPAKEVEQRMQLLAWVKRRGYSGISENKIAFMMHECNSANAELFALVKAMDQDCGAETLIQQLEATSVREDLVPRLSEISTPIHFLYGEQDRLVNPASIEPLLVSRSGVSQRVISRAGHMSVLEAPEAISDELNAWFCSSS